MGCLGPVELWVVSEYAHAKGQSALALQVVFDAFCVDNVVVKGAKEQRVVLPGGLDFIGKGKLEAAQNVPEGGVGIGQFGADEELGLADGLVGFQNALEEGEELWDAVFAEIRRFLEGLVLLVFVVLGNGDGVVGVVGLVVEIEGGQRVGEDVDPIGFILAGKMELVAEIGQDGRRLVDEEGSAVSALAGDSEGGRGEDEGVSVGGLVVWRNERGDDLGAGWFRPEEVS